MKPLTSKQQAMYDYMREAFCRDQRMPSYRDLMAKFDILSPNGVHCHIRAMVQKGMITVDANTARGIKLAGVRVVLEDV
jgi:repressor LexA